MPTINKLEKKIRVKIIDSRINTSDVYKYIYNTSRWKELRLIKLGECPLCEICKEEGRLTLAEQVHHIKEISTGSNIFEMQNLGYNWENLKSVCKECHKIIHKKVNKFI